MSQYKDLDEWIATLRECKPITEANVKALCDKVRAGISRLMISRAGPQVNSSATMNVH